METNAARYNFAEDIKNKEMNITTNTDLILTLGVLPAVVLAIHEARPEMTARQIAQLIGRDYSRTTQIIKKLKAAGMWKSLQNAKKSLQNANFLDNSLQNAKKEVEKETKKEKEKFPPYPLYKEKEINKEKDEEKPPFRDNAHTREEARELETITAVIPTAENKPSATTRAHALASLDAAQSVNAVSNHASQHTALLKQFCMNNKITREEFKSLAAEIATDWQLQGVEHNSEADARQHFFNLLRIKAREHRKRNPRQESAAEFTARMERELNQVNQFAEELENIAGKSFMDE